MKSNENNIKKLLLIGLIGAIITFIGGELTIGWTVYPEASNYYSAMLAGCKDLTIFQLALGILFGGIGIPMQYYGFEAISKIIEKNKKSEKCAKLVHIGAVATAFFGSLVHILCIALMFIIKIEYQNGFLPDYTTMLGVLPQSALDFTIWAVLPISFVCLIPYTIGMIAMFWAVFKKYTDFPKWACIFNPLTMKILLNVVAEVAPNTKLFNGIRMANMGLGALFTFAGFLILIKKKNIKISE